MLVGCKLVCWLLRGEAIAIAWLSGSLAMVEASLAAEELARVDE